MSQESSTPWMDVAREQMKLGPVRIKGSQHNARIQAYLKSVGYGDDDDTNWCAAFVSWCLASAGYSVKKTRHWSRARHWLDYGIPEYGGTPRRGAIAVFSRPGGPTVGHVGFFLGFSGKGVTVLGGNQDGGRITVKVLNPPKFTLLGLRWPVPAPVT